MTAEQLRLMRDASPFQPFSIHLADGKQYHIKHRDYISIAPNGRTVLVYGDTNAFSILDLMLVTELVVGATSTPSDNGA